MVGWLVPHVRCACCDEVGDEGEGEGEDEDVAEARGEKECRHGGEEEGEGVGYTVG